MADYKSGMYAEKKAHYFQGIRAEVIALIPATNNRVIELGCGVGLTLLEARKAGKASEIVGIDIMDRLPQHDMLTRYYQGDIDAMPLDMERESFDVALCADILEHLVDPWSALRKISLLLKPGGTLIVSLPNARNYVLALKLLFCGDFQYQSDGLLDRGHLRFFCKKNMMHLIRQAGFQVVRTDFQLQKLRKLFYILSFGLAEQFLVKQYLISARKV